MNLHKYNSDFKIGSLAPDGSGKRLSQMMCDTGDTKQKTLSAAIEKGFENYMEIGFRGNRYDILAW